MKKSLIAVAVAGAFASTLAYGADTPNIEIYGKADLAVGTISNGLTTNQQLTSQVTKLGFKGAEDLGGGTAAIWQIEQQIDIDNAGSGNSTHNTFAGRNSFLGLKNDAAGTLMAGRHDTPYKESTRSLDVFGDQFADNRHLMGGGTGLNGGAYMDARPGNELMWQSPSWGGVKVAASYAMGAELATTGTQQKGSLYALSAVYDQGKNGPIYAAVAIQNVKYGSAATGQYAATGSLAAGDSLKAVKAGIGYHADAFKVNAVVEKLTSSIAANANANLLGRTDFYVAGQYNINETNDLKAAYTKAGNSGGVANTGATMIGLGFDHYMSKKTSLYAQYVKISNGSAADFQFNNAATTGVTTAVAGAGGTTGTSPKGILVGMKHDF
jgi:predicted porin